MVYSTFYCKGYQVYRLRYIQTIYLYQSNSFQNGHYVIILRLKLFVFLLENLDLTDSNPSDDSDAEETDQLTQSEIGKSA